MNERSAVPFAEAWRLWLKVGCLGFGGPAGQIALMHRLVVDEKKWIDEPRYLHALNFCMLLPGPEAQQLATYVGWMLHGTRGGLVAGILFVLPGALVVLALSVLYAGYAQVPVVQAAFFGLKAAVLALVAEALWRIARRALKSSTHYAIAAAGFAAIYFFQVPFPWIVVSAGAVGYCLARLRPGLLGVGTSIPPPAIRVDVPHTIKTATLWLAMWLVPVAAITAVLGVDHVFSAIARFFSVMAVVTFGGAYAVLSYVAQQAVDVYGWLTPREMIDGLALAETTPGPLILVNQFVGFLAAFRGATGVDPWLAGIFGAVLTIYVTFAPSFLWIFVGAPYVELLRGRPRLDGALGAISAAVVGVILNLSLWFALHTVFGVVRTIEAPVGLRFDWPAIATVDLVALSLCVAASLALLRFRIGMPATLLGSAAAGVAYYLVA